MKKFKVKWLPWQQLLPEFHLNYKRLTIGHGEHGPKV